MPLQTGDIITEDTVFVDAYFQCAYVVYMSGSGSRWVEKIISSMALYDGMHEYILAADRPDRTIPYYAKLNDTTCVHQNYYATYPDLTNWSFSWNGRR